MPSGGRRVGAGRKPVKKRAILLGMDGVRVDRNEAGEEVYTALVEPDVTGLTGLGLPPEDLTLAERAMWVKWAPMAIARGTLIRETEAGFRSLCDKLAKMAEINARLNAVDTGPDAQILWKRWKEASALASSQFDKFMLIGSGKPEAAAGARKPAANPWAKVASR